RNLRTAPDQPPRAPPGPVRCSPPPINARRRCGSAARLGKRGITVTIVPRQLATQRSVATVASRSRWTPLGWLRRRREAERLAWWTTVQGWRWVDTVDGANLVHRDLNAAGIPHTSAPQVHWADLGPPVTLLVRM